jgi:hypothetical protein
MEAGDAAFRSEADTDRSVLTDFSDGTPKGEEFFSRHENASLFEQVLREPRPAKYRRDKDARFFQPHSKTARNPKVFNHCFVQLSEHHLDLHVVFAGIAPRDPGAGNR